VFNDTVGERDELWRKRNRTESTCVEGPDRKRDLQHCQKRPTTLSKETSGVRGTGMREGVLSHSCNQVGLF